jgi:hypothetical protein
MEPKESKSSTHFWISIVKSVIRFSACYFLFNQDLAQSAGLFAIAEGLGIAEEIF